MSTVRSDVNSSSAVTNAFISRIVQLCNGVTCEALAPGRALAETVRWRPSRPR